MFEGKTIGVVVPAHNEEKLIGRVIDTMPDFVDKIVVIDDKSSDETAQIVAQYAEVGDRVELIQHQKNQGVGGAIVTGYKRAMELDLDVAVVMAGDAQMDPDDLPHILDAVVHGRADYVKGNRLFSGESWKLIPKTRYIGNSVLSLLTKIASGYYHVADSQTGYTAVSVPMLKRLNLDSVYPRYGVPNDLLIRLNVANSRVGEVPIHPVYNIGEASGIKLGKVIPTISWLLFKLFFWRLLQKYIIRDFHPLVFFYLAGFILFPLGFLLGIAILIINTSGPPALPVGWIILCALLIISGSQSFFFAMWFDMDYNRNLCVFDDREAN